MHRRRFIASGLSAAGLLGSTGRPRADETAPAPAELVVTAASGERLRGGRRLAWTRRPAEPLQAAAVIVRPDRPRQRLFGFGAALTEAACSVLSRLDGAQRAALLERAFGQSGLRLTMCRLCIGASDYATELFSYDDGAPDPTLSRFSIAHDRTDVLPRVREALALRPDLFVFAAPWSPPGWMKYGGSMQGGSIKSGFLAAYAEYLRRFLDAYEAEGVPVHAMTVQNEIDADQSGRMPACTWSEETERIFIVRHLGPMLRSRTRPTRLWLLDDNYDLWGRVLDQLDHPALRACVDGVAWHGYAGAAESMRRVGTAHPDLAMHWTEGGPTLTDPDYADGWARGTATIAEALNNGAESVTLWNLVLDPQGGPTIGPFHCGGLLTVDATTGDVRPSGYFFGFMHVTHAFAPGGRVVESAATGEGVAAVAALAPDGRRAAVVANTGGARPIHLVENGWRVTWDAPGGAVASFTWS